MKKGLIIFLIFGILFLGAGVFAESLRISGETEGFVRDVAVSKGVPAENIREVKELNLNDLPEEIKLENIDETNLALYQVNLEGEERPVYVITASETKLKKMIMKFTNKMFLSFGYSGELYDSSYLKSATGVLGNLDKGYVMIREGSLTGISTNLEVIDGSGAIEVMIYKNGELMGFRNTFYIEENGVYTDYDTLSDNLLTFYPGDIISLYAELNGNLKVKDINTLLEISTN